MSDGHSNAVQTFGPWVGAFLMGLLAWVKFWADARAIKGREEADLIKIAQDAASGVIRELREEANRQRDEAAELRDEGAQLRRRVEELENEMSVMRAAHVQSLAAKDAEISMLRARERHWQTVADVYERLLEANAVPHEKPAQPFWRVPAGDYPVDLEPN